MRFEEEMRVYFACGGVIGIVGAIVEKRILLEHNIDVGAAIRFGGATLFGAGLAVGGARKYLDLRRSSKNSKE